MCVMLKRCPFLAHLILLFFLSFSLWPQSCQAPISPSLSEWDPEGEEEALGVWQATERGAGWESAVHSS